MTNKINRNGKISFWKFMFSLLIIAYHVGFYYDNPKFIGGYIGVEFFFIISGYYLCKKCINYKVIKSDNLGLETFNYIFTKIKKLLPYIIGLWILAFPLSIFVSKLSPYDYSSAVMNLLFIPNPRGKIISLYLITWYITAMLVVESILFPILIKYKKNYVYNFSFLLSFFILSYMMIKFGSITDPWDYATYSYKGIVRALLDINIGIMIYGILDRFKNIEFTDFSKFILTIFEIIGYLSIFYISNLGIYKYDIIMLGIITFCLTITLSEKVYLCDFSNNKLFYYMEKLSIPIYINQYIFIELSCYINKKFNLGITIKKEIIISIIISIVYAIFFNKIIEYILKKKQIIKSIFIN